MTVATERHVVNAIPPVRARRCGKCPFNGRDLDAYERERAKGVRKRVADNPGMLWGCHETVRGGGPRICAGFAMAHRDRLP